ADQPVGLVGRRLDVGIDPPPARALDALAVAGPGAVARDPFDVEDGRAPRPVVLGVREIREDLARRPRDHDLVLGVDSHGSPPRCAPSFSRPLAQPAPYMSTGPGPAKLSCSRTTSVLPPSSRNSTVTSDSRVSGTPDTQRHV